MLKIGLARADITPHAGIRMAGFGKRNGPSVGVNDPIFATCLVADDGQNTIAMLDCDLVFVGAEFTAEVRGRAEALAGIPAKNIMLGCTHTHYGPEIAGPKTDGPLSYEQAYRWWLSYQLAGLVAEAKAALQPARMSLGLGVSDIGINRRERTADGRIILGENPAGTIDRSVSVCRFDTPAGKPLAVVANFATHPVGQDVQERRISADYVGCARRVAEAQTGALCLFWQGAAGNINIRGAETTFDNTCSLGKRLGAEIASVYQSAKPAGADFVRACYQDVEFPAYRCLSAEHAGQRLAESQKDLETTRQNPKSTPGLVKWCERDVQRAKDLLASWTDPSKIPPPVKAQLQTFAIGDLAWAAVPGELFNELGSQIKQRSPFAQTCVVAYANDWIGYLPTVESFAQGGYEVSQVCNVAPEALGMLVDHFVAMLGRMKGN